MKCFAVRPAWAFVLMAAFLMGNAHAKSPSSGAGGAAGTSKAHKKANSQAGHVSRVTFLRDSAETPKERSSRLKRECKGRVNAGACAGYTY